MMQRKQKGTLPVINVNFEFCSHSDIVMQSSLNSNCAPIRANVNSKCLIKASSLELTKALVVHPPSTFKKSISAVINEKQSIFQEKGPPTNSFIMAYKCQNGNNTTKATKARTLTPYYLMPMGEAKKTIGFGSCIPIYPLSAGSTPSSMSPETRKSNANSDAKLTNALHSKRSYSTFKSRAEKKWQWKGSNGLFNDSSISKWHKLIQKEQANVN